MDKKEDIWLIDENQSNQSNQSINQSIESIESINRQSGGRAEATEIRYCTYNAKPCFTSTVEYVQQ